MKTVQLLFAFTFFTITVHSQITYSTTFGTQGTGLGQFEFIGGLANDGPNRIYAVDIENDRVQGMDSNGNNMFAIGIAGTGPGQLDSPRGITISDSGNIFVSDGNKISAWDQLGNFLYEWGTFGAGNGQFWLGASYLSTNKVGHILAADPGNDRIQTFLPDSTFLSAQGTTGTGNGEFDRPFHAVHMPNGGTVVVDRENHRFQVFGKNGAFQFAVGTNGSGPGEFQLPTNAAVDAANYIYIADDWNHRVQVFDPSGNYYTQFCSGPGTGPGQVSGISGITITSTGSIFVADAANHRILKWRGANVPVQNAIPIEGEFRIWYGQKSKKFYIYWSGSEIHSNTKLQIHSLDGRSVNVYELGKGRRHELNLAQLPDGVYAYRVLGDSDAVKTGKFLVRN